MSALPGARRVFVDSRAETAARLALLGGRMARAAFARAPVAWKADNSMVTAADLAIQQRLEQEIAARHPGDAVVGEEATARRMSPSEARHCWHIDPIDGTNNFGRRLPGFAVSVGVFLDGAPLAGAVCDPLADMLFTAARGAGAWLNGERLTLRAAPLSARSLFAIRSPYAMGVPPFVGEWLRRYRLRRYGSAALHLCYVALGGLAFVHDDRASLWDIAGAAPIVLEAGGVLTREDGGPLFPVGACGPGGPIAFLAGNPLAHAEVLATLVGCPQPAA